MTTPDRPAGPATGDSDAGAASEAASGPPEEPLAAAPVRLIPGESAGRLPERGIALCLSGGGYRAMLFHLGVLWRLNEAGLLPRLDRVSSVSGGSITAGVLAAHWARLAFDDDGVAAGFVPEVVDPLRRMASTGVDRGAVVTGVALPFTSVSDRLVRAYREELFADTSLQDLPDHPRFVLNATNLESGVLMRFSKPYLADYRVGRVDHPDLPLALAVAASSAYPPYLSPCTVDLRRARWVTEEGNDLVGEEYRGVIELTDGGVYDNLGLETAWKRYSTVLVSDGGGRLSPDPDPSGDWPRHLLRVLKVIDSQVRALRRRQLLDSLRDGRREGMYVSIRSRVADFPAARLPADPAVTGALAAVPTRLDALDPDVQERLVNWGYAVCDAGLRSHVLPALGAGALPYPDRPLDQG